MLFLDVHIPELIFTDKHSALPSVLKLQHRRSMLINDSVPPIPDMVGGGIIVADWEGVHDH